MGKRYAWDPVHKTEEIQARQAMQMHEQTITNAGSRFLLIIGVHLPHFFAR
jgi:hypothetical protein